MAASILQLTDPHIGADWRPSDPLDTLRAVLAEVRALPQRPAAALVTGDLANGGSGDQYERLAQLLSAELDLPLHVLPGNHDDRAELRRWFDVGGEGAEPIRYAIELDRLRVLMLDTTIPGEDTGALDALSVEWAAGELDAHPRTPTVLAMHHPPFLSGARDIDRYALSPAGREAVARLVSDHPQVCGTIAGHVHRTMVVGVGGRPAVTIPSTYCQLRLDFAAEQLEMVPEPTGFALHALVDGALISHVQTLPLTA